MKKESRNPAKIILVYVITFVIYASFSGFLLFMINMVIHIYTEKETDIFSTDLEKELDSLMEGDSVGAESLKVRHLLDIYETQDSLNLFITDREGIVINSTKEEAAPGDNLFAENGLLYSYQKELSERGVLRFTDGKWLKGTAVLSLSFFQGTYCVVRPVIGTDYRIIVLNSNVILYNNLKRAYRRFLIAMALLYVLTVMLMRRVLSKYRQRIVYLATIDELTGLANRKSFIAQYEHMRDNGSLSGAMLFMIDIDNFKSVNDTLGHAAGDRALVFLANKIKSSVDEKSAAARWGGDEFIGVLAKNEVKKEAATDDRDGPDLITSEEKIDNLVKEVREGKLYTEDGKEYGITISIGAVYLKNAIETDDDKIGNEHRYSDENRGMNRDVYIGQLKVKDSMNKNIELADRALYESKSSGRDRATIYRQD